MNSSKKLSKKDNTNIILYIMLAILILFVLTCLYVFWSKGLFNQNKDSVSTETVTDITKDTSKDTQSDTSTDTSTKEETVTPQPAFTTFKGKSVTAQLPIGWSMKEYYNGQGTKWLPGGSTYTGFTGLSIKHGTKEVFKVQAVSGIGFMGCSVYAQFPDDSSSYQQEMDDLIKEMDPGMNLNVVDYTKTPYSEFQWLGTTFRRIGTKYYADTKEGNKYFEPACETGIRTIEDLEFRASQDGYKYPGNSYFFEATSGVSKTELGKIDTILESMKTK